MKFVDGASRAIVEASARNALAFNNHMDNRKREGKREEGEIGGSMYA